MPRPRCLPTQPFHWYYYTRQAVRDRCIVIDAAEIHLFRKLLAAALIKGGAHLHFAHVDAGVLHLGLQSGQCELNILLGTFCQRYARSINSIRSENGAVFRPHARMVLIERREWFLPLGRYIHWLPELEPSRRQSSVYWNTSGSYRNQGPVRGLMTNLVFRMLSGRSRKRIVQRPAYRLYFDQRPSDYELAAFRKGSPIDSRILGNQKFVSEVLGRFGLSPQRISTSHDIAASNIQVITDVILENFRGKCELVLPAAKARKWKDLVTLSRLCSESRDQPLPMLRALITSQVVAHRMASVRQVEALFRRRPGTLSLRRRRFYEDRYRAVFGESSDTLGRVKSDTTITPLVSELESVEPSRTSVNDPISNDPSLERQHKGGSRIESKGGHRDKNQSECVEYVTFS